MTAVRWGWLEGLVGGCVEELRKKKIKTHGYKQQYGDRPKWAGEGVGRRERKVWRR